MGKFQIFMNDDEDPVWESELEATEVDQIKVNNARGEVTVIGSPGSDTWIRLEVHERAQVESYLDQIEAKKAQERRDLYEPPSGQRPENDVPQTEESEKDVSSDEDVLSEF